MSSRRLALALAAAALLLQFGVTEPLRERARAAAGAAAGLSRESRRTAQRLAELERRERMRARAARLVAPDAVGARQVADVRRDLIAAVDDLGVQGVRLSLRPGRPPAAASVRLGAEGSYDDMVALARRLADERMGLVLERVSLAGAAQGVSLQLDALGTGARP